MKTRIILTLITICFISCNKEKKDIDQNVPEESTNIAKSNYSNFKIVSSTESGISFNNLISHDLSTKFNLFDYDYFYNGSGVGIADLNNDGLEDIFFCGNQVPNKIYLNKDNLTFEDISESSNINSSNKYWSSGVTFADINNDGWMDIYVSQGGPHEKIERANLLYINQGDLTFKEEATSYGLADTGISTQAAFFDYDKDGDLDCIVMNENDYYGNDPRTFFNILSDKDKLMDNSSHLYRNDNNKFVNVTESSGLLNATFGLGLCVSDINNDNWLDIYIANDYYIPDAMYINNKNGTFTNTIKTATNQVSFYGMGLDIEDLNNDNLNDIIVLDMASSDHIRSKTLMASMNESRFNLLVDDLSFQHQYMFNSVQMNVGNNQFHNISSLTGMSKTDWSWAALVFDTNHDSNEDIYVTNGYRRYALDNDSRIKVTRAKQQFRGNVPLNVKEQIYNELPSERLPNILYQNHGNLKFEDVTSLSDLNVPSFSNGAAYSDLDNDGDLDIVVNNMDHEAFLFKNQTIENNAGNYLKVKTNGELSEDFAKVRISFNGISKTKESKRVRGYLSAVDKTIHFGLGYTNNIDTLKVTWQTGKSQTLFDIKANTTITLNQEDALEDYIYDATNKYQFTRANIGLIFNHTENDFNDFLKEVLLPYKQSNLGPSIAKADVNGDSLDDILIGGAFGQAAQLYLQNENGFNAIVTPDFENDANYEDMEALFIDIDNDSDQDLYVVSGGSEFTSRSPQLKDRVYFNDGNGNFTKSVYAEMDNYTISGKTVTKIDFDQDGDQDIIVGNRIVPQQYPIHEPSIIYLNDNGSFKNVTGQIAPEFEDFGMVNKVIATDFNNDGWQDFIAVGEWTHIGLFLNSNGTFTDISAQNGLDNEKGWWFNVTETDVNNDGLKDYLVGNIGENIKFKVSKQKPLRVYADDFDNNGTHDVVLSTIFNDRFVPVRGKECSTQQMPFISEKIPTFNEFANSTLEDIYGEKIYSSYQREANQFKTVILLNQGDGNFKTIELPKMVQSMPILDAANIDYNGDGIQDLIVVGNIYETEVETPRLDNPFALVLQSNGKDGYEIIGPEKTGLYIKGNAKSVEIIKNQNKTIVLVGCNDSEVEIFEFNSRR